MTIPSFRDVEQLSASLDGQLSQAEKTRLDMRVKTDTALAAVLMDLQQARSILRHTPKRRSPRNFTLTARMAGIRPPVPRIVPALSWASALALLLFIVNLGTNLLSQVPFGAVAPMMAAAPMTSEGYGVGGGPAATQPPASDNSQVTPTPETLRAMAPQATVSGETLLVAPPSVPAVKAPPGPVNFWPYIWLGLAVVLISMALLVRLAGIQSFRRKAGGKSISKL
jgi:hypothetical protein